MASGPVRVIGAGRTDKGVHAVGQVASFRMDRDWAPERLQLAANFHLPEDVRVWFIKGYRYAILYQIALEKD